jgi:hypothetical protein
VWAGQVTTVEEAKLGTEDLTMKYAPTPINGVEPPDQ